jgi:acetyltransferase-like isoleucine patch superfamily enzyme
MLIVAMRNILRNVVVSSRLYFLVKIYGMNISKTTVISFSALLDKTNPKGINIGEYSYIANGVLLLTHDYVNQKHKPIHIGSNCFIGANAIIMPGVTVGSGSIIAAASVVLENVPKNTLVAGNPAKVKKNNLNTTIYGRLVN